jgi:hypothetical protein
MEDFRKVSSTKQDEVFSHIITNYIFRNTIQSNVLISFLRQDKLDQLFSISIHDDDIKEEDKEFFSTIRRDISSEILESYIYPEPPVPMDLEIIVTSPVKKKERNIKRKRNEE